ncbi:MAG: MGMT family protein [Candidatus Heimdallarchaeota archaeon]
MYIITEEDEKLLATLGPYQQAVLRLLAEVPKGTVVTYGDLEE